MRNCYPCSGIRETQFTEVLYLDELEILHQAVKLNRLSLEIWNPLHIQHAHLSYLRGMLRVETNGLSVSGSGKPAECYTGNLFWRNYELTAALIPVKGVRHNVLFRGKVFFALCQAIEVYFFLQSFYRSLVHRCQISVIS